MGNREEARRWLDQARADLKTARDCLKDGDYYASAFFAQQASEKALKGFLYGQGFRALITPRSSSSWRRWQGESLRSGT
ncbi:hypothetical protein HRbin11_00994 [bacterium HR11]|nr:hypothetical protein HRbin11_00994 [bacterium HR11]